MSTESILEPVFRKGCLVDLNIGVWTAERRLQPEDLGLTKEEVSSTFTLGHKKLIPFTATSKVRRLESLARTTLERYSFPFPFGGARYVPRVRLEELVTKLDHITVAFNALADDIVANYSEHRLAMRTEYVQAAHDAYNRRVQLCGGLTQTHDEYVNEFLARIDKAYPDPKTLRRKYHMSYVVFQTNLPDLTRATYADISEDSAKIALMREAFVQSVRQQVDSFAETTVLQMRQDVSEVLGRAIHTLSAGKRPTSYTLDMVRKMIDRFASMDIVGDEEFKVQLLAFKTGVLDAQKPQDIISNKDKRNEVARQMEALKVAASDPEVCRKLVERYRRELAGV